MRWQDLTWENCATPATDSDLAELEKSLGIEFPTDFREFFKHCHGATPLQCDFHFIDKHGTLTSGIGQVFALNPTGRTLVSNTVCSFGIKIVPFAETGGGDLICMDLQTELPSIKYWNHEQGDFSLISNSFEEFIDSLFIPDDILNDRNSQQPSEPRS